LDVLFGQVKAQTVEEARINDKEGGKA